MPTNNSDLSITDTPTGMEVIATQDGALVDKIDTKAISAALSPDGRQVLLTGWNNNTSYATPWTDVYDIASGSIVKHLDDMGLTPTRRMDGIRPSSSPPAAISDTVYYLASVEPDTWAIVSEWKGPDYIDWLMEPQAR